MEHITLTCPATRRMGSIGAARVGVVASGDMEVLLQSAPEDELHVKIITSVDNSRERWSALMERISTMTGLPSGRMIVHDFGATPGVARLRVEQAVEAVNEEANHD